MKKYQLPFLVIFSIAIFTPYNAYSSELAALASEVENFSDAVCGQLEISGNSEKLELSGEADASLKLLSAKLGEIGFSGAIDFISDKYIGVLQKDLASDRTDIRDCRLKVWSDLRGLVNLANSDSSSSKEQSLSEKYDLPMEIRVSNVRAVSILDGSVRLSLFSIKVSARKKRSTLFIEIQNRPRITMTLAIDNRSYKPVAEFDYRDGIFEIEIIHQNIEDQIATVRITERS